MSSRACLVALSAGALLIQLSLVAAASASAFGEQSINPRPTAHGTSVLYNALSANGRELRLMLQVKGVLRALSVPARHRAFDVAFGTDRDGRQVATYSACPRDSATVLGALQANDHGCDVMAVRTAPGARPQVVLASTAKRSYTDPVMVAGTVAAVAQTRDRIGVVIASRGRVLRRVGPWRDSSGTGAMGLAFDGRRVAATWSLSRGVCPGGQPGHADALEWRIDVLTLRDGRRTTALTDLCRGITSTIESPSLVGGHVFALGLRERSILFDIDLHTRRRTERLLPDPLAAWAAVTPKTITYASASATENRYALQMTPR